MTKTNINTKKFRKIFIASLFAISILILPLSGVKAAAGVTITQSSGSTVLVEGGNALQPGARLSYGYTFQVSGNNDDGLQRVDSDSAGNLYMGGTYSATTDIDPTRGVLNSISPRAPGMHYVNNMAGSGGDQIYLTKVNHDGTLSYSYSIGNTSASYLADVLSDSNGNLYAIGFFAGTVDFDPTGGIDNHTATPNGGFFTKINSNGSYGYTRSVSNSITFYDLTKDSSNNIYVAGSFNGVDVDMNFTGSGSPDLQTSGGSNNTFVVKINSDGSYGGSHVFGGAEDSYSTRVVLNSSGAIYVAGGFTGDIDLDPTTGTDIRTSTGTGPNVFLTKINADGSYGFGRIITGSSTMDAEDLKVDNVGNVYLSGDYSGTVDFNDDTIADSTAVAFQEAFIIKMDADGTDIFDYTLGGTATAPGSYVGASQIRSIVIDADNNAYYSGVVSSTAAVDFDLSGGVDSQTVTELNGFDAFMTRLNADGSYGYTYLMDNSSDTEYSSLAIGGDGRLYAGGYFNYSSDLDPTAGTDTKASAGSFDAFVTMFVPDDVYMIRLADVPADDVTIGLSPNNDLNVAPSSITITPAAWDIDRFVFVSAVDDTFDESAGQTGFVEHTATSADPAFNGITIADLIATISDNGNDTVPITTTVSESEGSTWVSESGVTDTYSIVLGDQPVSDVTVTPSFDAAQVSVTPASLTFTRHNWNIPQSFTVSAVDDAIVEGNHTSVITHTAVSADPIFNGIAISSVTANIVDDDGAVVNLSEQTVSVVEGGATDSFTVALGFAPANNVTIAMTTAGRAGVAPASLTFTPANFSSPQTVTVTAVNDPLVEGLHSDLISFAVASLDAGYDGLGVIPISVNITDNDAAEVNIVESSGSTRVTEGGSADSYTLALTSQPTGDVDIALSASPVGQITVDTATLTFTNANWNVPQTVTVTAVNNHTGHNHTATISSAVSSGDSNFDGIAVADISVTVIAFSGGGGGSPNPPPPPANPNPQPVSEGDTTSQQINSGNASIVNLLDGTVGVNVASGTFGSDVTLKLLNSTNPPATPSGYVLVDAFDVNAYLLSNGQKVSTLSKNISLTINYGSKTEELKLIEPGALGLYYWDAVGGAWITVNGSNDLMNKKIMASIDQFGTYAVFGKAINPSITVPPTPPAPQENAIQEYVVQSGDSLKLIAQKLFGDESKWTLLVNMNLARYPSLATNPNAIYIGWILQYPTNGQAPAVPVIPPVTPPVVAPAPVIEGGYGLYTVQPGDDLQWIAQKLYGDSGKWTRLVELNQDQFPSLYDGGANAVYTGWVLRYDLGTIYDYELVYQSPYPAELKPGEVTNVWIEVKNIGTATWNGNVHLGSGSVYGNSAQQQDYISEFANSDWLSTNRPVGMSDGTQGVAGIIPGWNVRFQFNIKAPSIPGAYKAYFTPVADGTTWMKDIGIYWEIKVR